MIFLKVTAEEKKRESGEEGIGRSSAATPTKEDKRREVESGAMTDYEAEITLPETTSTAAPLTTENFYSSHQKKKSFFTAVEGHRIIASQPHTTETIPKSACWQSIPHLGWPLSWYILGILKMLLLSTTYTNNNKSTFVSVQIVCSPWGASLNLRTCPGFPGGPPNPLGLFFW